MVLLVASSHQLVMRTDSICALGRLRHKTGHCSALSLQQAQAKVCRRVEGVGCAVVSVVLTLTVHENPWGIAAAWVDPASLG